MNISKNKPIDDGTGLFRSEYCEAKAIFSETYLKWQNLPKDYSYYKRLDAWVEYVKARDHFQHIQDRFFSV